MPSSHDNASSFLVRVASVAALAALAVTAHAGPRGARQPCYTYDRKKTWEGQP